MAKEFSISLRYRFFKEASMVKELLFDARPSKEDLLRLSSNGVDVYTFPIRTFLGEEVIDFGGYTIWMDNIALLRVDNFQGWWGRLDKKTRNMVRKAAKQGVVTYVIESLSNEVADGLWRIYNETPIRQGRWFKGYGQSRENFRRWQVPDPDAGELIGAFWMGQLIGFVTILYGDRVARISQFLSMVRHFDKAPNNALIAKAVERCCERGVRFLIYARMGNHPSLDKFKEGNGFLKYPLPRCYVPLTRRGEVALRLKLYGYPQDRIPESLKKFLIPAYNLLSRKLRL
jgi:hypothetical protein